MRLWWLLALFVALPLVELGLLIEVGRRLGTPATIALVIGTGVAGAVAAQGQGFQVMRRIQRELEAGQVPAEGLVHGLLVLAGGVLLLLPGLLTDCVGFALLLPAVRRLVVQWLRARMSRWVAAGTVRVYYRW